MKKVYQFGKVTYGFVSAQRKWNFTVGSHTFITECPGKLVAEKVAGVVAGAMKRTKNKGMDGLGKSIVQRMIAAK